MRTLRNSLSALLASAALLMAPAAVMAAASDAMKSEAPVVSTDYTLDTILVVHNWVLCVSESSAEVLARARVESADAAAKAYADLASAKACGRFAKLGVQLREPLYRSGPGRDYEARVFSALVNVGAGWQNAYVVAGLPE